jgi:hypothetical protein
MFWALYQSSSILECILVCISHMLVICVSNSQQIIISISPKAIFIFLSNYIQFFFITNNIKHYLGFYILAHQTSNIEKKNPRYPDEELEFPQYVSGFPQFLSYHNRPLVNPDCNTQNATAQTTATSHPPKQCLMHAECTSRASPCQRVNA